MKPNWPPPSVTRRHHSYGHHARIELRPTRPRRSAASAAMMQRPPTIAVSFDGPGRLGRAEEISRQYGLPIAKKFNDPHDLHLAVTPAVIGDDSEGERLELRVVAPGHPLAGGHGVYADLTKIDTTSPAGRSLKSPLFKAVGVKSGVDRPTVLDATAGIGEDAWLLAAAGCTVTAVERQPIIHALLTDALRRARVTAPDVTDRINLLPCRDAAGVLTHAPTADPTPGTTADTGALDVVLIDPMFPGAEKRKTTERKPLRVLRWLAGDDTDADNLWALARSVATRRVVVKRPRAAPPLAGKNPTVSHAGRGFRFDVYPAAAET
ncbi:MAG: class I SAM-dependent methyltransferase [Planctomycetota bacterium]